MIIKMLTDLGKKMDEYREDYNRARNYKKKNQSELKNITTEIKNILEGINSRSNDREE